MIFVLQLELLEELKLKYYDDPKVQNILQGWKRNELIPKYSINDGLSHYKQRVYVAKDAGINGKLLSVLHDRSTGGHLGYDKAMHKMRSKFFWLGMKYYVKKYIREC